MLVCKFRIVIDRSSNSRMIKYSCGVNMIVESRTSCYVVSIVCIWWQPWDFQVELWSIDVKFVNSSSCSSSFIIAIPHSTSLHLYTIWYYLGHLGPWDPFQIQLFRQYPPPQGPSLHWLDPLSLLNYDDISIIGGNAPVFSNSSQVTLLGLIVSEMRHTLPIPLEDLPDSVFWRSYTCDMI
jgi:hypothetical protein